MNTRPCPVCGADVPQRSGGRPAVYCSTEHRRIVEHLRRDLPRLETDAVAAEQLAADSEKYHQPSAHARRAQADRLAVELTEARHIVAAADALTR